MPLRVGNSVGVDLSRFVKDDRQLDFIVNKTKTDTPTLEQLDSLVHARKGISDRDRGWLQALVDSVRGDTRGTATEAVTKDGVKRPQDLLVSTMASANRARQEGPLEAAVRSKMVDGAVGQKQVIDAFVSAGRDYAAAQRFSPPVLAICGPEGHGKEQAVAAFAHALSGQPPRQVDLSDCSLNNEAAFLARLFGDAGPLNVNALTAAAASGLSTVRLTGLHELAARAPRVAAEINRLLCADKDAPGETAYVHLVYVLDFNGKPSDDAGPAVAATFGANAHQKLSAEATFGELDRVDGKLTVSKADRREHAEAMEHYARAALAHRFKSNAALSQLATLQYDDAAREALGRALATSHAPLKGLDAKLQALVLQQFDVDALEHPKGGVLRLQLAEPYASDPRKLNAMIEMLHAPLPNLRQAQDLFLVTEVGVLASHDNLPGMIRVALKALDDGMVRAALVDCPGPVEARMLAAIAGLRDYADALDNVAKSTPQTEAKAWKAAVRAADDAAEKVHALADGRLKKDAAAAEIRGMLEDAFDIADPALREIAQRARAQKITGQ